MGLSTSPEVVSGTVEFKSTHPLELRWKLCCYHQKAGDSTVQS